jgi:hypothetical protein
MYTLLSWLFSLLYFVATYFWLIIVAVIIIAVWDAIRSDDSDTPTKNPAE